MANQQIGLQAVFEIGGFSNGLQTYMRGIVQAQAQTTQAASAINSAGGAIASGFGAAMGTVAVDAIRSFIDIAQNAVADVIGLASGFEQLEFSIRSLNAGEQLLAGSTKDFNTIFAEQEDIAQGNLLLLQDMAIPSVFTTQQLAAVQQMFQNFGFLNDEAFAATGALTQFATAGNVAPERLNRIAYAISQVRSEGRLLSADARQFGQAGIRIIEILADKLGKTQAKIREDMKDGLLTADIVLPVLFDYFQNFEGVTAESEKTIRGVISALQDIREISLGNFGRGLFDQIMPSLEPILEFLKDERIRAGAQALGELLGPQLATAITAGITALQSMFTALTSISPQTATFIALLAGGAIVLTGFAAAAGIISLAIGALVTSFTLPVAAVSAFVAAYATNFGNVATITNTVVNAVVSTISGAVGGFDDFASGIAGALNSAAQAMGDFLGQVAEWGSAIVSTLAEGITSAVSVVVDAISVLAEAMAYLMAPGSPPRMLPHLTEWGKETANEWLMGWTQADFNILGDITNFVEQALGKDVSADKVIAVNQVIAQAVDQIREIGKVSQETFAQIQSTLGAASDEVFGYLNRYEQLASATTLAEKAQARLNDATEYYDALLSPLKHNLDQATEAVTRAKEAIEAKGLERLLQTTGVSDLRKQEALARLQQIGARQQVFDVEAQKQSAVDGLQAELNLATKLKDEAQTQLNLFGQRIQVQNQFIALLEKEQSKASSGSSAAAKAHKEGLSALDKQLKLIQLQQQELQDMIAAAKARKVLEDENATAAQKTAAQLELQEIAVRRQLRDIEAAKLGGTLDAIRQIQIVAADLEKPGKGGGKLDAIAGAAKAIETNFDPKGRLAQFRTKVDEMATSFETMGTKIQEAATKANDGLPVFLRFFNEPGTSGPPPLIANLTAALVGLATFKFASITAGLLGLGPAGAIAAAGIGVFVAAFQGNWFGIRDTVNEVVPIVRARFEELRAIFQQGFTGAGLASISDQLRSGGAIGGFTDQIDNLTFKIGEFSAKVVEDAGKIGPAFTQMKADLDAIFGGEGTIFSKLVEAAGTVSEAFGDNSAARLALGAFTTFLSVTFGPQIVAAGSALLGLLGPIGISALAVAGLYLAWEKNIGGIKTYVETNFPTVGTAITTVIDTISTTFQGAIDLIAQFKKDLDNLSLFGGASGAKMQLDLLFGEVTFSDLSTSFANLDTKVRDAIKGIQWSIFSFQFSPLAVAVRDKINALTWDGIITADIFGGLQKAVTSAIAGAFTALGGDPSGGIHEALSGVGTGLGEALGATTQLAANLLKEVPVAKISAAISDTLVNVLGSGINGALNLISSTLEGFSSLKQMKQGAFAGGSAAQTISQKVTEALLGALAGVVKGAFDLITSGKLLEAIKATVNIVLALSTIIVDVIVGVFKGVGSTISQLVPDSLEVELQNTINSILRKIFRPINSIIRSINELASGLGLDELAEIKLPTPKITFSSGEESLLAQVVTGAGGGAAANLGQKLADEIQKQVDAIKLRPPDFDVAAATTEGKFAEVGRLLGVSMLDGFKKLTPADKENAIGSLVKLDKTQLDATFATSGQAGLQAFLGGFTPTEAEIAQAKEIYASLGLGVIGGLEATDTEAAAIRTYITGILTSMKAVAEAQSPSELTKREVGIPMGQGVILGAAETITTTQQVVTEALNTMLTTMTTTMLTFHQNTLANWTQWGTSVYTVITTAYTTISASTTTWVADILSQYTTLRTNLESTVRAMTSSVVSLFSSMHSAVTARLSAMIRDILSKLEQLVEDIRTKFTEEGEDLGTDFARGIEKGILDYITEIRKAAATLAEEAVKAAQDTLLAKSPSQRARVDVGHTFGSGAILGILDSIPQAITAAQALVQSMLSSANHTLHDSSEGRYGGATNITNVRNYNLNVQSQQASRGITYDFGIMQLMESS